MSRYNFKSAVQSGFPFVLSARCAAIGIGRTLWRLSAFDCVALSICVSVAVTPTASANPKGGKVVAGSATIETTAPDTVRVRQQSNRAIVDWQSFSVGASEHTEFAQPSPDALIVNRVVGSDASEILGRLSANGRVMLLNPNGVLFGADAQVDVGGLIASTLGLTDEQILNEDFRFSALPDGSAHILNLGEISASDHGLVALIAPSVRNDGVIRARLGNVALIAGDAVTLDTYGDGLVQFQVDAAATRDLFDLNGSPINSQIENAGLLSADGGSVMLSATALEGLVDNSINMTGVAQARSVSQHGGEIVLRGDANGTVLVSGILDASGNDAGESGGRISVFADRVAAMETATLDASGSNGGGSILFGGEFQGRGQENATRNYVADGAMLRADALDKGDGGQVIVWSDENTAFYGTVSARGGVTAGNGGFAEISGKENLAYSGEVDLSAANGRGGEVLFDPKNINISLLGTDILSLNDAFSDFAALSVTLTPVDILALLSLGTDVTLQANNDLTLTDGLTVNNALGAGGNINLQAGRHINLNADITSDDGDIFITAGHVSADAGNRDAGVAALTMADGVTLDAGSGDITLVMGNNDGGAINLETLTTTGDILVRNLGTSGSADIVRVSADALLSAGSIAMLATEADAVIGTSGSPIRVDVNNLELQLLGAGGGAFLDSPLRGVNIGSAGLGGLVGLDLDGSLEIALDGALTQSERILNSGLIVLDAGIGNDITLSHASNDFASVGVDAAANVTLLDVNGIDFAQSTISGAFNGTANGQITNSGAIVVSGATTLSAGVANSISLNNVSNNFASIGVTAATDVDLADINAIDLGDTAVSRNLTVSAGGAITDSGTITVGNTTQLNAGAANDVTLDTAGNDFATVQIGSANNVSLVDTDDIDLGASTVSGALTLTADGDVTDSGALAVAGLAAITTGVGSNINFDTAGNNFASVQVGSANNVALVDTDDIALNAMTVGGDLTVTAGGAISDNGTVNVTGDAVLAATLGSDITLDDAANRFGSIRVNTVRDAYIVGQGAVDLGDTAVSRNLTVSAGGAITDSGTITVGNTTQLNAGAANDVTLDTAGNDFATVQIGSANNVSLVDTDDIDLGASTVSGALTLTADGDVTDSGALAVAGLAAITTGVGSNINFDTAGNNFASVQVGSANNVALVDTDDIALNAMTVGGDLTVTAGGAISDNGTVNVTGDAVLAATLGSDITLDDAANRFGSIRVNTVRDAYIVGQGAVDLGDTAVSRNLTVSAGGAITDSGTITVGNTTQLNAGAANDVTLDTAGNDFATVQIGSANNVTLVDTDDIDLGASTVSGALTLTADGDVTDSGALAVAGTTTVAAGATNNITFDTAGNDFATVQIGSANNVTLVDTDDIDLGASTVSGAFTLTADGDVTDSGALAVAGTTTVAAGATNNITFDTAGNDFATVQINSGNDVTLVDTDDIDLGASTVSGELAVVANDEMEISGPVVANGTTSLQADSDSNGVGDFSILDSGSVTTNGNDLAIRANDVTLAGSIDASGGRISIEASDAGTIGLGVAGGDLELSNGELARISASETTFGGATSGAIVVNGVESVASSDLGTVILDASQDAKSIVFSGIASFFDGLIASASNGVHVESDVTTTVSGLTIDGDANSAADGTDSITLDGTLNSAGALVLNADSGGIVVMGDSGLSAQSNNVVINDAVDGAFDMRITAVEGDVTFAAPAGKRTALNNVELRGNAMSGEVHAQSLQVDAKSAVLTGSVDGQGGSAAAARVENTGVSDISFNAVTVVGSGSSSARESSVGAGTRIVEYGHRSGPDAEPSENNQLVIQSGRKLASRGGVCETVDTTATQAGDLSDRDARVVLVRNEPNETGQFEECDMQLRTNPSVAQLP